MRTCVSESDESRSRIEIRVSSDVQLQLTTRLFYRDRFRCVALVHAESGVWLQFEEDQVVWAICGRGANAHLIRNFDLLPIDHENA